MVSTKPFTCQSFRQNYFSRQIEWAVGGGRQPINLSTPSPLTLPPLPGGWVSLPLPTPPGGSTLPSLSLSQADSTPPPLPPFLGSKTLPPPLLEVSRAPPLVQFYSNVISKRIYSALTTTTERTYFATTPLPKFSIPPPPTPLPWGWNPPSPPPPPSLMGGRLYSSSSIASATIKLNSVVRPLGTKCTSKRN